MSAANRGADAAPHFIGYRALDDWCVSLVAHRRLYADAPAAHVSRGSTARIVDGRILVHGHVRCAFVAPGACHIWHLPMGKVWMVERLDGTREELGGGGAVELLDRRIGNAEQILRRVVAARLEPAGGATVLPGAVLVPPDLVLLDAEPPQWLVDELVQRDGGGEPCADAAESRA